MSAGYLYSKGFSACICALSIAAVACGGNTGRGSEALSQDTAALSQLREINSELSSTPSRITPESFARLQQLREKYPAAPEIIQTYKAALIARDDWQSLENLILEAWDHGTREDLMTLAKVQIKLGKFTEALATLMQVGPASPEDVEHHSLNAMAFASLGDDLAAAAKLDAVWQAIIDQKRIDDVNLRGMLYFREKKYPKAIETFKQSLEMDPNNVVANNMLSRTYAASGNPQKADAFRAETEKTLDQVGTSEKKKLEFVDLAGKLKAAWAEKRYGDVITIAEKMLPIADEKNRPAVAKYLSEARALLAKK